MGTTWSVRLVAPPSLDAARVTARVQACLDRVVAEMSTWEPGSALSRFNAASAGSWHDLPADLSRVLAAALAVAGATGGAFDPTVGPLVDLWGFGPSGRRDRAPEPEAIAEALRRTGSRRLRVDGTRAWQPGGVGLDLGGIAKGFGVDAVAVELTGLGLADILVEVGGELRGHGTKPDGSPWWVALERPPGGGGLPETIVALHDLAVATSGDYRRIFRDGGEVFAHTLDPRTGTPVRNGISSVSVVGRSCMRCDALATALTVLGLDAGMAFAAEHEVAAHFAVWRDGRLTEHSSPALDALS